MIHIDQCSVDDYEVIDNLFKMLINEIIMNTTGDQSLFKVSETIEIYKQGLSQGLYRIFKATDLEIQKTIGFISICESFSLYADGSFGIIQELFVLKEYRSKNVGEKLLSQAVNYGKEKEWKRLEVCTPPLPEFERSFEFYAKNGFVITGGKKLKKQIVL